MRSLFSVTLYLSTANDWNSFSEGVLECIDGGLDVFGASVKSVVYWGLEHEYGMKRTDVLAKPEIFCGFLKEIFGVGSKIVESWIVNKLKVRYQVADLQGEELYKAIPLIMIRLRHGNRTK